MEKLTEITAKNLHRHELIGLTVEIIDATDHQLIGLQGEVVNETKRTLTLGVTRNGSPSPPSSAQRVTVLKKDCLFRFTLPSGELVDVSGEIINEKSEDRLKKIIRKRW
ncbi:MAG: ribonuclease P protein subunit [Candidatus Heimdallarchaeota archaeon]|nr:ribonuclease P protein subunit [Candidatus Heimdallarchaeota archaeon]